MKKPEKGESRAFERKEEAGLKGKAKGLKKAGGRGFFGFKKG